MTPGSAADNQTPSAGTKAAASVFSAAVVGVFSLTLFLSAALMFAIQPMTGKMLLPLVGGTPAGWIVAMAFFQVMLLGGYLLAHGLSKLSPRMHALFYLGALSLGMFFFPVDITQHAASLPASPGAIDIFKLLCASLAVPFIAISATSSTIQRLFTATGHKAAHDPYFLYVASNIGSLAGLLLYPAVFEPAFTLSAQAGYTTFTYAGLIIIGVLCLLLSLLAPRREGAATVAEAEPAAPLRLLSRECMEWAALAFIPSSLLLGVTIYITTDIMSVPMMWVLPLGLYLVTFMVAFSNKPWVPRRLLRDMLPAAAFLSVLAICVMQMPWMTDWGGMVFHLTIFTVVAMACHIELANRRPLGARSRDLTAYYLMMSVGGALGGIFNAFVIPVIADRLIEFPLVLAAALLLHPAFSLETKTGKATLAALVLTVLTLPVTPPQISTTPPQVFEVVFFSISILFIFCIFFRSVRKHITAKNLILTTAILLFAGQFIQMRKNLVYSDRNFYGTVRIFDSPVVHASDMTYQMRMLHHGTTIHGVQVLSPPNLRTEPTAYYTKPGPLGDIFNVFQPQEVGAIGLGAGVLSCHSAPERHFTFFEIDPAMETVAREKFFYLKECASEKPPTIIIGDGRLEISKQPAGAFDLIIVDAFSSDSIPVHLLTLEAVIEYISHTNLGGAVAFHLSNRYFMLEDRLVAIAEQAGLQHAYRFDFDFKRDANLLFRYPSKWLVISRGNLDALKRTNDEWVKLKPATGKIWTDDYSDLLSAIYQFSPTAAAKKAEKKSPQ
ncbi:MAG TPA: hypothetical protein PLW48_07990 [Alphaproteobacteria bacterium]|nr:hypothetical protein [Alphaproteobacteria bacterium]